MLPRADMFKEVIFIPRLIVFNESFVPVGPANDKEKKPLAVIWHEGIAGRKKEDIVSTFHTFFLKKRDFSQITIWLDNCGSQNKNWALFSYFVYIVNSDEVNVEKLEIKFFEVGHTFMSADSFHHQVELSMKRKKKIFDFNDFSTAVKAANSSETDVHEMSLADFSDWNDFKSEYKLKKLPVRPHLNDMVSLMFEKGQLSLKYKLEFSEPYRVLNFVLSKCTKQNSVPKAECRRKFRGISKERRDNLVEKLKSIIPQNRLFFWKSLPLNHAANGAEIPLDDDI